MNIDTNANRLPYYPTIQWGSRKNERWSSKIHYYDGGKYTLCGLRIKGYPSGGDGMEDICERCENILESRNKK